MDFMKKILLGIGLVSAFSFAHAATPTHAAPFEVNVPDLQSGVEFTIEGFFEKLTNHDLDYAVVTRLGAVNNTTNYDVKTIYPNYDFGFRVAIGYIFPDSGNDIRASYTYLKTDNNDRKSILDNEDEINISPLNNIGETDANKPWQVGAAHSEFEYNMVNLNVGQFIDVGTRLSLRLSAGLRYADFKRDFDKRFEVVNANEESFLTEDAYSKFEGIGPEFGVEADYHVGACLGIVGRAYTGLLVGDMKTHTDIRLRQKFTSFNIDWQPRIQTSSTTFVVPYLDTKLGVDYSFPFLCESNFTAELGWQFTHYFNATERMDPTYAFNSPNVDGFVTAIKRKVSSIGFNGPYLSLSLKI